MDSVLFEVPFDDVVVAVDEDVELDPVLLEVEFESVVPELEVEVWLVLELLEAVVVFEEPPEEV